MAMRFPGEAVSAIGARLRHLVLRPTDEWTLIRAEPMTVRSLYIGWIMPLAAIGPVAGAIGLIVFGRSFFGVTFRPPVDDAIGEALIGYVLMLVATPALALIVDSIAPRFGATRNAAAALKLVAFALGPFWAAGIFRIIPALSDLMLVAGLYSLYLVWAGLPRLMKAPKNKAPTYGVVTIVATILAVLLVDEATGVIGRTFIRPPILSAKQVSVVIALPGRDAAG